MAPVTALYPGERCSRVCITQVDPCGAGRSASAGQFHGAFLAPEEAGIHTFDVVEERERLLVCISLYPSDDANNASTTAHRHRVCIAVIEFGPGQYCRLGLGKHICDEVMARLARK